MSTHPTGSPPPTRTRPQGADQSPLTENEIQLIDTFRESLESVDMDTCGSCNLRWFDLQVQDGECRPCKDAKRGRAPTPGKWTSTNNMDPGPNIQSLMSSRGIAPPPVATQVKEMLMSKIHVQVAMWKVGGRQAKYTGQTICFGQDPGPMAYRLPRLPQDLDILIVCSRNEHANNRFSRRREFTVRRHAVEANLRALKICHPMYADIQIDPILLEQLPVNDSVFASLCHVYDNNANTDEPPVGDPPELAQAPAEVSDQQEQEPFLPAAMIPDMPDPRTEDKQITEALLAVQALFAGDSHADTPATSPTRAANVFSPPPMAAAPINEHQSANGGYLLVLAFPFLYPSGVAGLRQQRPYAIRDGTYYRHLMRYPNGRFARHPRFRYYAWNSILRHQSRRIAQSYVTRNSGDADYTAEDLTLLLDDAQAANLAGRVCRAGQTLRGTSAYWGQQSRNLQSMVRQIDQPTVFFTLSAADYHWPDLHAHMPVKPVDGEDKQARVHRTATNIHKNPAISAYYFKQRFDLFFQHVMTPLFGIRDFWYRYEWQSRGSPHVHGLFWGDGPCLADFDLRTGEGVDQFVSHWQQHMTAVNPVDGASRPLQHPSARPLSTLSYTNRKLAELLNTVQRHTVCNKKYCLCQPRNAPPGPEKVCRFKYPKDLQDHPTLCQVGRSVHFLAQRNDPLLNEYNPVLMIGWRANIDMGVISDRHAVLQYIAKYISKAEKPSASYATIMNNIAKDLKGNTFSQIVYQKMLSAMVVERNWSAQEVMHMLLQLQCYGSSRIFGSLCVSERYARRLITSRADAAEPAEQQDDDSFEEKGIRDTYYQRPNTPEFGNISLYEWAKQWSKTKSSSVPYWKLQKERIIRLWPAMCPGEPDSKQYQQWCHAKLLLHHSHRNPTTLNIRQEGKSWSQAWTKCVETCHPDPVDTLPRPYISGSTPEDKFEDATPQDDPHEGDTRDEWMWMAAEGPVRAFQQDDIYADLGLRDRNTSHNWLAHTEQWGLEGALERVAFLDIQHGDKEGLNASSKAAIDPESLNSTQRSIYDRVRHHHASVQAGHNPSPFLINVDGTAGTGKSYLIEAISQMLSLSARQDAPILRRLAPTGVAAYNIDGETYHSALGIRPHNNNKEVELAPGRLAALQASWQSVKYLIIDKKSMIGCRALAEINQRLRMIFPNSNGPFGGLSLLYFGDFAQLPPVGNTPVYAHDASMAPGGITASTRAAGRRVYLAIAESVALAAVMQQSDTDAVTTDFKDTLRRLRSGEVDVSKDYSFLAHRISHNVSAVERHRFRDALLLAANKDDVRTENLDHLLHSGKPILMCPARHTGGRTAKRADNNKAADLPAKLLLMIGAKVMITRNIWTGAGLVNGTMGTVKSVGFTSGDVPGSSLPAVVMVLVPAYHGPVPEGWRNANGHPIVPIVPVKIVWQDRNATMCCTQFPLQLAYAITIHKSQGTTQPMVRVHLGKKEFSAGLTFVALSRAKRVQDLLIVGGLDTGRLESIGKASTTRQQMFADEARRAQLPFYPHDLSIAG